MTEENKNKSPYMDQPGKPDVASAADSVELLQELQPADAVEITTATPIETEETIKSQPSIQIAYQELDEAGLKRLKGKVEAALFVTGKALSLSEIGEIVEAHQDNVETALIELMNDYAFREDTALEIDDTDGYILQVREECADVVHKMMPLEISAAELRTLSAIAIKAPILQSDLVELRGASAYEHIAELYKHKLISKRREGRSYVLNVTKHFYEYFKLVGDKKDLAALVSQVGREENTRAAADHLDADTPDADYAPEPVEAE